MPTAFSGMTGWESKHLHDKSFSRHHPIAHHRLRNKISPKTEQRETSGCQQKSIQRNDFANLHSRPTYFWRKLFTRSARKNTRAAKRYRVAFYRPHTTQQVTKNRWTFFMSRERRVHRYRQTSQRPKTETSACVKHLYWNQCQQWGNQGRRIDSRSTCSRKRLPSINSHYIARLNDYPSTKRNVCRTTHTLPRSVPTLSIAAWSRHSSGYIIDGHVRWYGSSNCWRCNNGESRTRIIWRERLLSLLIAI